MVAHRDRKRKLDEALEHVFPPRGRNNMERAEAELIHYHHLNDEAAALEPARETCAGAFMLILYNLLLAAKDDMRAVYRCTTLAIAGE